MNTPTFPRQSTGLRMPHWRSGIRVLLVLLAVLVNSAMLFAQSADSADSQTIQKLLQRIDQLEARVARLEAAQPPGATAPSTAAAATPTPAPTTGRSTMTPAACNVASPQQETESEQQPGSGPEPERMDVSKTLLRIRGFGDINFHGDTGKSDTTSFTLGQLNLFVTSDISEKFKFLGEIVFEGGPESIYGVTRAQNNAFGVDVERYLLQYSYNDYFNVSVGRYHTAIGYYNTAYHHSTWFQTTTGRPFLFSFEDQGGILPIHTVGASASGLIPSGALGLHYVAEVGNGRASRTPFLDEPVQNFIDEQNHKAYNLALFARPEAIRGLQAGFSVYRDVLEPSESPRIGETILAAHAVYIRPNFEWLNEALVVRHAPLGQSHVFQTPGFYTQISKRFGSYRPYFRYQYVNGSDREPIFPDVGRRQGPSAGIRFDASESVALKLQYDYTTIRNQQAINALAMQVGFTF
ncbi:MAG: hypothetical protein LAO22_12540 [Acidobacteriia bacterium]|nr:hypothetical protein [Terriglobia bacterium]